MESPLSMCCHPHIASLAFCRRSCGCPLYSGLCIASAACLLAPPLDCPLLPSLHCFTGLMAPALWPFTAAAPALLHWSSSAAPLWLSTVATPVYCFTGLLAPSLWLSTVATPVHCCTVLLATSLWLFTVVTPVHCYTVFVSLPLWLFTVATPVYCFTGLLAPPLWPSTVGTPVHCFTGLLAPPLWLSTGVTLALIHWPSGATPMAVHWCHPCIASLACCRPYGCPLQRRPLHCFSRLLAAPLWPSIVATPVQCFSCHQSSPLWLSSVRFCHPCTLLHSRLFHSK
jgi:hypothetical protein